MKSIMLFVLAFCFSATLFAQSLQPLNSLSELDITATAVQFKNVATGQYIVLQPAPQGGGSLQGSAAPDGTPWYFYQAAGAGKGNLEIKRKGFAAFNWSNYDNNDDTKAFISWNHAKRFDASGATNTTSPAAPHAWTIEEVSAGVFKIKEANGQYLELMPNLKFDAASTGPKIITRAWVNDNKHQQWVIEVNTKLCVCEGKQFKLDAENKVWELTNGSWVHVGDRGKSISCNRRRLFLISSDNGSMWRYNGKVHDWTAANALLAGQDLNASTVMGQAHFLASSNGKHFFYMQENGDLGIWSHTPDPQNIWSSKTSPKTDCTLRMQTDGHLVAYDVTGGVVWASGTHVTNDPKYGEEKYKPVKLILEDDGRIVLYSQTGFRVWDNVNGKYPLN